jgi:hypothetical protein
VRRRVTGRLRRHWALAAAFAVWVVYSASFNAFLLAGGDAVRPFSLVQRIFGESRHAFGYEFGLGLFEVPFYAVGRLLAWLGVTTVGGLAIGPGAISVGASLVVLLSAALMVALLSRLALPGAAVAVLAGVFGTSLFFYGSFYTGQTQPYDALLATSAVVLLFFYFRSPDRSLWIALALGAVLGVATTVRYFTGAEAVALVLALGWLRRFRDAAVAAAAAACAFGLLAHVPISLGANLFGGYGPVGNDVVFAPANPLRMLFTAHRGLFVWSPVALLGLVGYVRLLRTRPAERRFLGSAGVLSLALVGSYAFFRDWDSGWSFGQRYYVPLFPVIVLGLASLCEWRPRVTRAAAAVCTAWTLFLSVYVAFGLGFDEHTSDAFEFPTRLANGSISPRLVARDLYCGSRLRLIVPRLRDCSRPG